VTAQAKGVSINELLNEGGDLVIQKHAYITLIRWVSAISAARISKNVPLSAKMAGDENLNFR